MDANVVTRDKSAVIQLNGRFDFNAHREFRNAMERALGLPPASVWRATRWNVPAMA